MAEGYVYTSATDTNDLLNQIVSQAAVHGWSQRMLTGLGGSGRRGHISKDGVTVNLASWANAATGLNAENAALDAVIPTADRITPSYNWRVTSGANNQMVPDILCINASSGFDGAVNWYRQPGGITHAPDQLNRGRFELIRAKGAIGKVHMFFLENPAAIFVVAEVRPGEFYWLAAGNVQKDSPFDGGQFFGASMLETNIISDYPQDIGLMTRVRTPQAEPYWGNGWGDNYVTSAARPSTGSPALVTSGFRVPGYWYNSLNGPSAWGEPLIGAYDAPTGRLWVHPVRTYARRPSNTLSYLGVIPGAFHCTMESFIGGDVVTIGGQEYMLFPVNWRASPFSMSQTTDSSPTLPWYRNNALGTGLAIRKPT